MGLDKREWEVLNGYQMKTLLLAQLGLGVSRVFTRGAGVLGWRPTHKSRVSPIALERRRFEEEVRGQFLKLKEKGLGISVFTL